MAKIISGHHLVGTTKNHVTATSEKSSSGHHLKQCCGHHVWRGDVAPICAILFWLRGHSDGGPRPRFKEEGAAHVCKRWWTQEVQSRIAPKKK